MRELYVVAVSEDGRHVVLASGKGPDDRAEFRVAMDDRLKSAIRGDLPRLGEQTAPQSAVTPKDIQARLRAGESVEQIAASAGVPSARVERFAGPVFAERERVVAGARGAVLTRPRRGQSALPVGDAVTEHLQEMAGYKPDSLTWSARREESGRWLVEAHFVSRAKSRSAGWRYDPTSKEVVAIDTWSAAVAHVDGPQSRREGTDTARVRRVAATASPARTVAAARPVEPETAVVKKRSTSRRAADRPTSGSAAAASRPAVASRPVVASRPAAASRSAAASRPAAPSRAAATAAATASAPAAAGQTAARRAAATTPAARASTPVRAAASARSAPAASEVAARRAAPAVRGRAEVPRPGSSRAAEPETATGSRTMSSAATPKLAAKEAAKTRGATASAVGAPVTRARKASSKLVAPAAAATATAARQRPVTRAADPAPATPALPVIEDAAAAATASGTAASGTAASGTTASGTATSGTDGPQRPSEALLPSGPPTLRVVPSPAPEVGADLDQPSDRDAAQPDPPTEVTPPRPAARRAAGGRATVPVWADVLMGTRSSSGAEPEGRD